MNKKTRYSPEVPERAVRLLRHSLPEYPSRWAAIELVTGKIGCTAETLRRWVNQCEIDSGERAGLSSDERQHLKELQREVKEPYAGPMRF